MDIKINVGNSIQDVTTLKKELATLKKNLDKLVKGSADYLDVLDKISKKTKELADANATIAKTSKDIADKMQVISSSSKEMKEGLTDVSEGAEGASQSVEGLNENVAKTGEVVDNVKVLRNEMKQLKSELLTLDKGSEEYLKTLQELANKQRDLNDMNKAIRNSAADLGQKLSNVVKLGKGLAGGFAAAQGAMALFGAESENLAKIQTRLQAAIALVNGLQGLEGLTKTIPALMTNFRGATTAVKGFITGLNGVKAAIAATGIGLLVVAVGMLAANWDKVTAAIKRYNGTKIDTKKIDENAKAVEDALDSLEKANDAFEREGLSEADKIRREREAILKELQETQNKIWEIVQSFPDIRSLFRKKTVVTDKDGNSLLDAFYIPEKNFDAFNKLYTKLQNDLANWDKLSNKQKKVYGKQKENLEALVKAMKSLVNANSIVAEVAELVQNYNEKVTKAEEDAANEVIETAKQKSKELLSIENEIMANRIAIMEDGLQKQIATIELNRKKELEAETMTAALKASINAKYDKEILDARKKWMDDNLAQFKEYHKELNTLLAASDPVQQLTDEWEERKKNIQNNINQLTDIVRDAIDPSIPDDAFEEKWGVPKGKYIDMLNSFGIKAAGDFEKLTDKVNDYIKAEDERVQREMAQQRENIWQVNVDKYYRKFSKANTDISKEYTKMINDMNLDRFNDINIGLVNPHPDTESWVKLITGFNTGFDYNRAIKTIEEVRDKMIGLFFSMRYEYDSIINNENATLEEKAAATQAKLELETEYYERVANLDTELWNLRKEHIETYADYTQQSIESLASSFGTFFGAMADMQDKNTEEGFKKSKKWQQRENVINTLLSATKAYQSMSGIPYVGPALGAVAAAAAIAAGIARGKQIEQETFSGGSVAQAIPEATQQDPYAYTRNLMTSTEEDAMNAPIKCYVLQADIEEANTKVAVAQSESSF